MKILIDLNEISFATPEEEIKFIHKCKESIKDKYTIYTLDDRIYDIKRMYDLFDD